MNARHSGTRKTKMATHPGGHVELPVTSQHMQILPGFPSNLSAKPQDKSKLDSLGTLTRLALSWHSAGTQLALSWHSASLEPNNITMETLPTIWYHGNRWLQNAAHLKLKVKITVYAHSKANLSLIDQLQCYPQSDPSPFPGLISFDMIMLLAPPPSIPGTTSLTSRSSHCRQSSENGLSLTGFRSNMKSTEMQLRS